MTTKYFRLLFLLKTMLLLGISSSYGADIQGIWLTKNGESLVKIAPCSQGICGQLIWLQEDASSGRTTKDKKNKDWDLRKRPLVGLNLLSFVKPQAAGKWSGRIYNPGDGNKYSAKLALSEGGKALKVSGCALAGLVCKEQIWYRIAENTKSGIDGNWYLGNGKVMAKVNQCGNALCAKAVWTKQGEPSHIMGMDLLQNMQKTKKGWKGKAIHPYEQKAYSSTITQLNANMVELEACLGGLVCQSLFWHRAAR